MTKKPNLLALKLNTAKDQLFEHGPYPKPFAFNHQVAAVFDDMVSRSVPQYQDVTRMAAMWTGRFYQPGSTVLDIGCSTGTCLELIARLFAERQQRISLTGIDMSEPMLTEAQAKLKPFEKQHAIELLHGDATEFALPETSVAICNYTLQFVPVCKRPDFLAEIFGAMKPKALLFLSEKVRFGCDLYQETGTFIYEGFKRQQGYSRTEIERKKEALDNVLICHTVDDYFQLLSSCGFTQVELLMRWNNFVSIVAMKP